MKKIWGFLLFLLCILYFPVQSVGAASTEEVIKYVTFEIEKYSPALSSTRVEALNKMNLNYGQIVQSDDGFYLEMEVVRNQKNIYVNNDGTNTNRPYIKEFGYKVGTQEDYEYIYKSEDNIDNFGTSEQWVLAGKNLKKNIDLYYEICTAKIPLDISEFSDIENEKIDIRYKYSSTTYEVTLNIAGVVDAKPDITTPNSRYFGYTLTSEGEYGPTRDSSTDRRAAVYLQYPISEGGVRWYYSLDSEEEITEESASFISSNITANHFAFTADRDEAYTATVYIRGYNLNTKEWLNECSVDFKFSKKGISGLEDTDTGVSVAGAYNTIPYDTTMTVSRIEDTEALDTLLKKAAGEDYGDYRAYTIDIKDPEGNPIVLLNETGRWGKGIWQIQQTNDVKKNIVFNMSADDMAQGFNPSDLQIYRLKDEELAPLYMSPTTNSMRTCVGSYEEDEDPSGTYVLMRKPLTDSSALNLKAGNYGVPIELVNNSTDDDGQAIEAWFCKTSEYDQYIGNNGAATIAVDEEGNRKLYLSLVPSDGNYLSGIKYNNRLVESVEKHMSVEGKYPKLVILPLTEGDRESAYVQLQVKNANTSGWHDVMLAVNYSDIYGLEKGVEITAPGITTDTGAATFVNDDEAKISLQCDAIDGEIYYTLDGSEPNPADDSGKSIKYTEPFSLSTNKTEGESYTIKAITVKEGYNASSVASKKIVFKAQGESAYTVEAPRIDARYDYSLEENGAEANSAYYKVSLTSETEGAKIYYTIDNSAPTTDSIEYQDAFQVPAITGGKATVIQAIAVKEGYNESEVSSFEISFSTNWWDNMLDGDSYQVPVEMINLSTWKNSGVKVDSMGAGALNGDATIYAKNGQKYLEVPLQGMLVSVFPGKLDHMWYWEGNDNNDGNNVVKFSNSYMYGAIEASYTYNADGSIKTATVPLYSEFEQVFVGIESNISLMGKQGTILWLDYSNVIQQITGKTAEKEEITATPSINYEYDEESDSFNVVITGENGAAIEYSINAVEGSFDWQEYTSSFNIAGTDPRIEKGTVNVAARSTAASKETSQIALKKLTFKAFGEESKLEDGTYQVPVTLMHQYKDEPSMGAGALEAMAVVNVRDGKSSIQLTFKGVGIDVDGDGTKYGHLQQLWSYKEGSTVSDLQEGNRTEVPVIKSYEDEDLNGGTSEFPQVLQLERTVSGEDIIYVRVKVDAMGDTQQDARLVLDYEKAQKVEQSIAGTYSVPVKMIKWGSDTEASMGNGGMEQTASLVVAEDGTAQLQLDFHSLQSGVLTGYLGWLKKVVRVENANIYGYPTEYTTEDAAVLESYEDVIDIYNHPDTGSDAEMKGKLYPKKLSIPVAITPNAEKVLGFETENKILIQIYVPIMEALTQGTGKQFAYMMIDWDNYIPDVSSVERTALKEAIENGNEKLKESSKYEQDTVTALQNAIAAATDVLKDYNATQEAINAQVKLVNDAVDALKKILDTSELEEELEKAKAIDASVYTAASYTILETEIQKTEELLKTDDLVQDAVESQLISLRAAIKGLIEKTDKTALQSLYDQAVAITNNGYSGWDDLQTAIANAKTILEKEDATQTEVNDQINALQAAIDNLTGGIDKSVLSDLIGQADTLDTSGKSDESVNFFEAVVALAKEVQADANATQQQIDKLVQLIEASSAALIQKEEANTVYDGTYSIKAALKHASSDSDSMGSAALKDAKVVKKGEQYELQLEFQPLEASLNETDKFTGYLAKFNYYDGYEEITEPSGLTPTESTVISVYEKIYDIYNDPSTGTDEQIRGIEYPKVVSIPIDLNDSEIWVQVYVPVMEAISQSNGLKNARLQIDWSTLTQISGTATDKTELKSVIQSAQKLYAELTGTKEVYAAADIGLDSDMAGNAVQLNTIKLANVAAATEAQLRVLNLAIAAGEAVDSNLNVAQDAVNATADAIQKTINVFNDEEVTVDKTNLKTAIETADTYLNNKEVTYTATSRATLQTARDNAYAVYNNAQATQTQVNNCVKAIDNAIKGLVVDGADKTELKKALETAKTYLNATGDYTAGALAALQSLYDTAYKVYETSVNQEEVDAQVRILNYAVENLKKVEEVSVDKTGLHTMLMAAANMAGRESLYTSASIKSLKTAIKAAEAVYLKEDATQAEVNEQASKLSLAMMDLEMQQSSDTNSGNNSNNNNNNNNNNTNDNDGNSTLDINNLADGVYSVTGSMLKIDKATASMSNEAINHTVKLTVENGKYYITLDFKGLAINSSFGYLSQLKYYKTGYTLDSYGNPVGDMADVTVDSYQTNDDGSLVSDTYGTNYPDSVTFELIPEALKDGYAPLQVFVPIMEAIAAGTGTQPVFLKLDWTTLAATTADDPNFSDDDGDDTATTVTPAATATATPSATTTLGSSSLNSGSSSLKSSGSSGLSSGSALSSGSGSSGLTSTASNAKTGDDTPIAVWTGFAAMALLSAVILLLQKKKRTNQ